MMTNFPAQTFCKNKDRVKYINCAMLQQYCFQNKRFCACVVWVDMIIFHYTIVVAYPHRPHYDEKWNDD